MSDLIRRQDVIDAILSEPHNEPRYPDWWVRKILEMPSGLRWIPVSEGLPKMHAVQLDGDIAAQYSIMKDYYMISDPVLVIAERKRKCDDDPPIFIGYYEDDFGHRTSWQTYDCEDLVNVIAWMPLPEPYMGGDDNDQTG